MIIMSVSKKKAKLYYCASLTAPYLTFTGGFVVVVLNKIHEARAFATYETLFRFSFFCCCHFKMFLGSNPFRLSKVK